MPADINLANKLTGSSSRLSSHPRRGTLSWRAKPNRPPAGLWCGLLALLLAVGWARADTNLSVWVFPGVSGRMLHQPDAMGNRILDFTAAGYRGGTVRIPEVPVKVTISPVTGDDGASIQAAINQVKALPLDANGFRGAVLLTSGEYDIAGTILIDASGIVLRGVGDGPGGTILRATGTSQRSLVRVTGSGSASTVSGTTRNITNDYVPVGARTFNVDSTSGLAVGDRVFVRRIATEQWIQDLGMDLLGPGSGGDPDDVPWTASGYHLDFDRIITRIEGTRITVDAPIPCAIEARYAGGTIRKFTWSGRIQNVGVEDIRGISDFNPAITSTVGATPAYPADEDHAWRFLQFNSVENAWVRRVTSQHFGYACVLLGSGARCVTVQDARSLDPVSIITGSRRYAFVMDGAQLCLVQNCYTVKDRHQFVTQARTMGPNVFVDGWSDTAYSDAGPHHRWGTGAIWDNVTVNGHNLNVQNRGNSGTGHGWAGANEVVWNSAATGGFIVQNPPGARNWLIGSIGTIRTGTMWVGPHDPGTYDAHGANVFPNSLYYAQLQDRLATPNLQTREYWLGHIDQFQTASPTGEVVTVDAAWRTAIQAAAVGAQVNGFDIVAPNQWVPFTFNFALAPGEQIVGASIAMATRAASSAVANDALYIDSLANSNSFASLGWLPIGTGTNTTVRVLDLGGHLPLLADGQLNLAVQNDTGIDWAMLEIHVAPALGSVVTNIWLPLADSYVRGGTYAAENFGSDTTLLVKEDSSQDVRRRAYLRWDLGGVGGQILHARVRLMPLTVGTNGLENGITLAASGSWQENTLTWINQPGGGKRFATWIAVQGEPVEFVVTPQVQSAMDGSRELSLQLFSLSNVGAPGQVSYASREYPDIESRPQLILVVSNTPASGIWLADANGDWSNRSNWTGTAIAHGADRTATFALDATAERIVSLDAPRTLGGLSFADTNPVSPGDWVITNNVLTLQVAGGTPWIAVTNRTGTIHSVLAGTQGLNKEGDGTLVLAAPNSYGGETTINAGALRAAHDQALGSMAGATRINNPASARLELSGNISIGEPLTISCKSSAAGNVPAIVNVSGANTLTGPLSLTTGGSFWTFEVAGGELLVSGSVSNITTTNVRTIWLRGAGVGEWSSAIANSAAGLGTAVRKDDPGTWSLSGTNTYTGNTVVSNGVLLISGRVTGGTVTVAGGTLGGDGIINGPVTVYPGATLSPGASLGTLTISNALSLAASSATFVEINAQSGAGDLVRGLTTVAYGGSLVVSNLAGTLSAGQNFELFSANAASGNFSSITPAPGPALDWNFNSGNGTLSVVALPPPQVTQFSVGPEGSFIFSGTGAEGQPYRILATTDLTLPPGEWTQVASGIFANGTFQFTDAQSTNHPQRFYQVVSP
jgi:autotransporter-associated beta strand protein